MIKIKENINYVYAFSIGLFGPSILKFLSTAFFNKLEENKKRKLFHAGIEIGYE